MKIGIVTNLYPPYARGGAEQVITRTVQMLLELGHDVFLVTAGPSRIGTRTVKGTSSIERIYRFFPKNIYFVLDDHRYPKFIRFFWHLIDLCSPLPAMRVGEVLDRERPDIVITHNLKGIGLTIPWMLWLKKIPHVHVVHDLQLIFPSGLLLAGREKLSCISWPFYAVYVACCRFLFRSPDLVIFPSQYLKSMYEKWFFFPRSEVIVLPNPSPDFPLVDRLPPDRQKVRLLFVGQLESHKGIRFLLEAVAHMPEVELTIAGEGTLTEWVIRECEKNKRLNFLGYICADHLQACLGTIDAVVVPSLCYENSPTVIYESLSAGVPVLASDIGGVGELVRNGVNGYLFKPGDAHALAHAIWRLRDRRVAFMATQKEISNTVAPFGLKNYTQELLRRLETIIDQRQKS